jgi:RNA polymerase sigma-70 factor (ECF subfamily)
MRSEREVSRAIGLYADTVRRVCFLHLKNHADTEDIFQTVFLKYALYSGEFESAEHEKAWLIRVTINASRDFLKSFYHSKTVPLELLADEAASVQPENSEVLSAVLSLPKKYRDAIYLHYYEGYSAVEIAKMLGKNENTVYSLLSRARGILKDKLGGDDL